MVNLKNGNECDYEYKNVRYESIMIKYRFGKLYRRKDCEL